MDDKQKTYRVSFSGGKDSTAMTLMLLEKNYPVDSIDFLDTKHEYPEVYEYLDKIDKYLKENYDININYLYLKKEWEFESWFYGKYKSGRNVGQVRGFPKVLYPCYLSRQKGRTLDRYDKEAVRYIGIGWNERHRVTDNPRLRYPLVEWGITEDKCVEYLKEKDLMPGHKKYYTRSGCWFCPKQSIQSARSLYIRHPDLWKELKEMEKISPHGWNMPGRTTSELEERFEKEIEFGEINLEDYK